MTQLPTRGMLRDRARGMRKQTSRAERDAWDIVRDNRLGFKFRRQRPIGRYIADFACVDAKLVIEIDGSSHSLADQIDYDAERTSLLTSSAGVCCASATNSCFPIQAPSPR